MSEWTDDMRERAQRNREAALQRRAEKLGVMSRNEGADYGEVQRVFTESSFKRTPTPSNGWMRDAARAGRGRSIGLYFKKRAAAASGAAPTDVVATGTHASVPAVHAGSKYISFHRDAIRAFKINLQLISKTHFSVHSEYRKEISAMLRETPSSVYVDSLQHSPSNEPIELNTVPMAIWKLFVSKNIISKEILSPSLASSVAAHQDRDNQRRNGVQRRRIDEDDPCFVPDLPFAWMLETDLANVDPKLRNALLPFQREGVQLAIGRQGRILIADDMGLGKTIQALCIACYYRQEWPLLVIVPSSLRMTWYEAFREWTPSIDPGDIQVIMSSTSKKDQRRSFDCAVTITSYDMAVRLIDELKATRFRVVIADESHFLKNGSTKRAKAVLPLLRDATRTILLSGTPALSRPMELFTQIQAIYPNLFSKYYQYGLRYCNAQRTVHGMDFSGSSNLTELQLVLESCIMVRRLKGDVLTQLPPKRRQQIFLTINKEKRRSFQAKLKHLGDIEHKASLSLLQCGKRILSTTSPESNQIETEDETILFEEFKVTNAARRKVILELWKDSSLLKLPAMIEYVDELLAGGRKLLVFAHHKEILDEFETKLSCYGSIRIDGQTPPGKRHEICQEFQLRDDLRVAFLSITAAGVGLTLTAASTVVFAELYWNPGAIIQAEDRAHRIGQQDSVNVNYLLGRGTLDDRIWPILLQKLEVLQSVGLAKDGGLASRVVLLPERQQRTLDAFLSSPPVLTPKSPPSNPNLSSSVMDDEIDFFEDVF